VTFLPKNIKIRSRVSKLCDGSYATYMYACSLTLSGEFYTYNIDSNKKVQSVTIREALLVLLGWTQHGGTSV